MDNCLIKKTNITKECQLNNNSHLGSIHKVHMLLGRLDLGKYVHCTVMQTGERVVGNMSFLRTYHMDEPLPYFQICRNTASEFK